MGSPRGSRSPTHRRVRALPHRRVESCRLSRGSIGLPRELTGQPLQSEPSAGCANDRHTGHKKEHRHVPSRPREQRGCEVESVQRLMQPAVALRVGVDLTDERARDRIDVVARMPLVAEDQAIDGQRHRFVVTRHGAQLVPEALRTSWRHSTSGAPTARTSASKSGWDSMPSTFQETIVNVVADRD
jgi:hypothetical protein